ncbi:hypothetical protein KP509_01G012800 [Ceratopteris richardii]|uniref:Uncharacterized protein n=1 Tax=Ceratopteris richardii TaxID=49495 RepID=A0A8T2VE79_CERRI|nr:hypothetical protein KP509_01G012800 [Ceratopteris richardii]
MALISCVTPSAFTSLSYLRGQLQQHGGSPVPMLKPLHRRLPCFASYQDDSSIETTPKSPAPKEEKSVSDKKAEAREAVQKGQRTAVVTGAIAVILGVAYLVLVQLLDTRGVNLVPPPPEAYGL